MTDTRQNEPANKLVVVTGASGHLGNVVCRQLLAQGFRVRAMHRNSSEDGKRRERSLRDLDVEMVVGDINDRPFLREQFADADMVVHCAALISIDGDPHQKLHKTNVEGVQSVCEACLQNDIKKLVHVSSVHMFDLYEASVLSETNVLARKNAFAYDASKREGYMKVRESIDKGLNACVVCPVGIIGPFDYGPSLMGKFFLGYLDGAIPALIEGGFYFADVRDTASGVIAALHQGEAGEIYLLGGHDIRIAELARVISQSLNVEQKIPVVPFWLATLGVPFLKLWSRLTNTPPLYTFESIKTLNNNKSAIDFSKAKKQLGYQLRPLTETISDTYEFFESPNAQVSPF